MDLVERFRSARRDPALAVLEGFHALKHAIRFGAEIREAAAAEDAPIDELVASLAPDVQGAVDRVLVRVPGPVFDRLTPTDVPTGVVALAARPSDPLDRAVPEPSAAPLVFLEAPRRAENVGAVVRVAAAAGASGVLVSGGLDPWSPAAIRGSAGLHFALPVAAVESVPPSDRPLVALDPSGDALAPSSLPARAVLAFGTEREGLTEEILASADRVVSIPMREGVSSLNLATAVAVALYVGGGPPPERRKEE